LISDFEAADGGLAVIPIGTLVTSGFSTATSKVENGAWHVAGSTSVVGDSRVTLVFNACVDARSYDGIRFSVTGWASTCLLGVSIVDTAHAPSGGAFASGSGPPDARPHGYRFIPSTDSRADAATTPMTVQVRFDEAGSGFPYYQAGSGPFQWTGAPNPAAPTDVSRLIALQWIFSGVVIESCYLDITIDDLAFY
jgi:hypothetical protein